MTIQINTRTFVGISNLLLQRQSDGVIFSWPQPETFVLNTNVEEREQMGRSADGRMTRLNTYIAGETPTLSVTYNYISGEMLAFQVGKQLVSGTFDTFIPRSLVVREISYSAAAAGFLYNGVLQTDAETAGALNGASASYTDPDTKASTALTRAAFDTFDESVDDQFAVGDDGALKFSTNLATANTLVTMLIPASIAGAKISETLVGPMRLYATMVSTDNTVTIFEAPNCSASLAGRSADFSAGNLEMTMFLNNEPGSCSSWSILETPLKIACQ
jgi:hypothetical protein